MIYKSKATNISEILDPSVKTKSGSTALQATLLRTHEKDGMIPPSPIPPPLIKLLCSSLQSYIQGVLPPTYTLCSVTLSPPYLHPAHIYIHIYIFYILKCFLRQIHNACIYVCTRPGMPHEWSCKADQLLCFVGAIYVKIQHCNRFRGNCYIGLRFVV
mgnify:CR=1 FL=1